MSTIFASITKHIITKKQILCNDYESNRLRVGIFCARMCVGNFGSKLTKIQFMEEEKGIRVMGCDKKTGGWRMNKWIRAAIPALLLHCSIGTVYCWSIFSQEIADYIGFSKVPQNGRLVLLFSFWECRRHSWEML